MVALLFGIAFGLALCALVILSDNWEAAYAWATGVVIGIYKVLVAIILTLFSAEFWMPGRIIRIP